MSGPLKDKTVAVIGCGGLGCNVLTHLAGMGTGELYFFDDDVVSVENLNRQFCYTVSDAGREKVFCASRFLERYAPEIKLHPYAMRISSAEDLNLLPSVDVLILAVDNSLARFAAQAYCAANGIPVVNGGVDGLFGTAYVYVPGKTPCLACAGALRDSHARPIGISCAVGVIGALCAELTYRLLTGDPAATDGKLFIYDQCEIKTLTIKSDPACGICNPERSESI